MSSSVVANLFELLSVSLLFRWVTTGVLFLIAWDPGYFRDVVCKTQKSSFSLADTLPIAILLGAVLYGVYRSLVFPWIECLFIRWFSIETKHNSGNGVAAGTCKNECCLVRHLSDKMEPSLTNMLRLWDMDSSTVKAGNRHKRITDWGDIVHSQLAGALVGLGGGTIVQVSMGLNIRDPEWLLVGVFFVLLVSGLFSYWRLIQMRNLIERKCCTN